MKDYLQSNQKKQSYSDLIMDLINMDYDYNEIQIFFINKSNISERLANSFYENIGLDFITDIPGEEARSAITNNMPNLIDDYSITIHEINPDKDEKRKDMMRLHENTETVEFELFIFNKLYLKQALMKKQLKNIQFDLGNDYIK